MGLAWGAFTGRLISLCLLLLQRLYSVDISPAELLSFARSSAAAFLVQSGGDRDEVAVLHALRADWNKQLAHSPCMRTQVAACLLQSGELRFDQLGGAVSLYEGEPRNSQRAQPPSNAGRHQATAADEWPPACKD